MGENFQTMRLSDFLMDVGRPVAYYPSLARILGIKETIFLCQLVYWHDKSQREGWVYKTADEWEIETGLSYREQKRARDRLKDLHLLEEREERLAHKMFYRAHLDRLDEIWRDRGGVIPETTKRQFGDEPFVSSSNNTEITTYKEAERLLNEQRKGESANDIAQLWNSTVPNTLSRSTIPVSRKRRDMIATRLKEPFWASNYTEAFQKIAKSDFCNGKAVNSNGWRADFEWIIKNDNNIHKVMEGKYDNKTNRRIKEV